MAQKINITALPTEERILYFQKAAEIENKSAHIIEKDYWVCDPRWVDKLKKKIERQGK